MQPKDNMEEANNSVQKLNDRILELQENENQLRIVYEDRIRKLKHEIEQLNITHTAFLKRLSYKILNPINGMLGIIDLLKSGHFDGEISDYYNLLDNNGVHMLSIVNDILDFSAISSNDIFLRPEETNIRESLDELLVMLRTRAFIKNNVLELEIHPSIPEFLIIDGNRLRQVLINLIDNSINNTKDGKIRIIVEPLGDLEDRIILLFKVEDNGNGIDSLLVEKLHLALSQNSSDLLLRLPGTGLGLAIAKELCKLLDGELSFDSDISNKTVFWFTATFGIPGKVSPALSGPQKDSEPITRLKILLVEDNVLNQKFAKATLARRQHIVDIAENGKEALKKYSEKDYDLILMDIQLPILDGIEVTKQIREIELSKGEHITIIAATAYALERDRIRCLEAGMDGFLAKPFRPIELYKIIDACYKEKGV